MKAVMKVVMKEKDVVQYEEVKQDHSILEENVVLSPSSPLMSMMMMVMIMVMPLREID